MSDVQPVRGVSTATRRAHTATQLHPFKTLFGACVAGVLTEALALGLVWLVWGLVHGWWFSGTVLGVGLAFGIGLGVAYGTAETLSRSRGLGWGLLAGLLLIPLPVFAGGYVKLRFGMRATLTESNVFDLLLGAFDSSAVPEVLVLFSLALCLYVPLLIARRRDRGLPAQSAAMALGGCSWLVLACAFFADEWRRASLSLSIYLLFIVARPLFFPLCLRLGERLSGLLMGTVFNQPLPDLNIAQEIQGLRLPTRRARRPALVLLGALAIGLATVPCAVFETDSAWHTVRRMHALLGTRARYRLAQAFGAPRGPRFERPWMLGTAGAMTYEQIPSPEVSWPMRREQAVEVYLDLGREGHLPSMVALAEEALWNKDLANLRRDESVEWARRAAETGEGAGLRVLAEVLHKVNVPRTAETRAECEELLRRATAAGNARAQVLLGEHRNVELTEREQLLRQAWTRKDQDPDLRARAAARLEKIYEELPDLRPGEGAQLVEFLDAQGNPLEGAVRIELKVPLLGGPGRGISTWVNLVRDVRAGRASPPLLDGARPTQVNFAGDRARAKARLYEGLRASPANRPGVREFRFQLPAAASYGTVQGTVQDAAGGPVEGRRVLLCATLPKLPRTMRMHKDGLEVTSDAQGAFRFDRLPPGSYAVALPDKRGYFENTRAQTASPGDTITLTVD